MNKTYGPFSTEALRLQDIELSMIRSIMGEAPENAINLALGELGFPMPQALREKAVELLENATPVYTPNAGLPNLREAIAATYSDGDASRVCVCNGAEEALFLTLFALLNANDTLAVPDPDYTAYPAIAKLLGVKVIRLPFNKDMRGIDWDLWEKRLSIGAKAIVLSHPSNPSGFQFSPSQAEKLLSMCEKHKVTLIVDEIYRRLSFGAAPYVFDLTGDNIIVIDGLSKSHCMSGWRIGWAYIPPHLVNAVVKAKQYVSTCTNWLSQQLAVYAVSLEGKRAASDVFDMLFDNRCHAISYLNANTYINTLHIPSAGPYIMLRCDPDDLAVARTMVRQGVITVPGSAFGNVSQGWLRINYAVPRTQLMPALEVLTNVLYPH